MKGLKNEHYKRMSSFVIAVLLVASVTVVTFPSALPIAFADSTGPNSPTGSASNEAGAGTQSWTGTGSGNPTLLMSVGTASDSKQAQTESLDNNDSQYLKITGFGFSGIPTNAIIDGISVEFNKKSSANTVKDLAVRIVKGGTIGSTDRSLLTDWPASFGYVTHGSSSDKWGESWTAADVMNGNFGVAIAAQKSAGNGNTRGQIDHEE